MPVAKREIERTPFGQRLFDARKRAGLSQVVAAAAVGMGQPALAEAEKSGSGSGKTAQLAVVYGCNPVWLASGEGEPQWKSVPTGEKQPTPVPHQTRPVWVVGKTQGGMPERIWDDGSHPVGATDRFALIHTTDPHAFICRVVGDSMTPRYMPGEYALVEPDTAPDLEDDVLVRLSTGETMLKRLLSRRGGIRLGSYNTTEVMTFQPEEVSWLYYVAHAVPARKIRERLGEDHSPPSSWGDLEG